MVRGLLLPTRAVIGLQIQSIESGNPLNRPAANRPHEKGCSIECHGDARAVLCAEGNRRAIGKLPIRRHEERRLHDERQSGLRERVADLAVWQCAVKANCCAWRRLRIAGGKKGAEPQ